MATIEQRDYFAEQLLRVIGKNASSLGDQKLTGFLSMAGELYDNELMVAGRAVNGWIEGGITPSELSVSSSSESYAQTVFDSVVDTSRCPMSWILDSWGRPANTERRYNTKKSAFWRVIQPVVTKLNPACTEDSWPSHLVWSNLYKVSPVERGNPSNKLCNIQLPACIELLKQEVLVYRPHRLLLLTGLDWAKPFLQEIAPMFTPVHASYVEAVAEIPCSSARSLKIVVAAHPQGKRENKWVSEVIEAFREN